MQPASCVRRRRGASAAIAALVLASALAACGREDGGGGDAQGSHPPVAPRDVAVIRVRDLGEIRVELFAERAPKTVESFRQLARDGFYAGTTFHRVIPGFMIQGGDPNSKDRDPRNDGMGGPGYKLPDEFNPTRHARGIVSMANAGAPNSGGSQFFILVADQPELDGRYTAFGRVVSGIEVVDRIAAVPRDEFGRYGPPDRPREDVVIEEVAIVPAGEAGAPGGGAGPAGEAAEDAAGSAPAPAPPAASVTPPNRPAPEVPVEAGSLPPRGEFRE